MPGRSWLRLAGLIAAALLLLRRLVIAYNLGRGKTPLGRRARRPDDAAPTTQPPTSRAADHRHHGVATSTRRATPPEENPDLAPLAVDGDPATAWRTSTYFDQFGPARPEDRRRAGTSTSARPRGVPDRPDHWWAPRPSVTYYLTDTEPDRGRRPRRRCEEVTVDGTASTTTLDEPATGRYLVVWLT